MMTANRVRGRSIVSLTLFLTSIAAHTQAGESDGAWAMELFDFGNSTDSDWQVVNDGVMGGRSQGFVEVTDGILHFHGELVTQGGGFTSIRTAKRVDLSQYDGLALRVRGNGRVFELEVNDGRRYGWRSVSRRAPFETDESWRELRVPFSRLRATVFGRPVDVPPLNPGAIERIGFYIVDGIDGRFRLEVDRVRAYRENATKSDED